VAVALFVTGQMFASLGLDLFGLLGVPEKRLSVAIVLGAVAVLGGITVIVRGQQAAAPAPARQLAGAATGGPAGGSPAGPSAPAGPPAPAAAPAPLGAARAGWLLLGLIAGAVLPVQGAVNAKLRGDLHEPLAVGVVSFAVATLTILIVLLVLRATGRTPRPDLGGLRTVPWWGWLGGACAAAYVVATFMLLPKIGAATTIALTVTGQQLASALIDHVGGFRMVRRSLTKARLTGLVLLVLGCLLVQLG
jgi:transporter family-2 protein